MKKIKVIVAVFTLALIFTGCNEKAVAQLQTEQAKNICELATMECRFHNVAKFNQDDAQGMLFWKKDKKFWLEYDALVKLGIDASLVDVKVSGDDVTITIPKAKILGDIDIDLDSITADSYIRDAASAEIKGEDETKAIAEAHERLKEKIESDNTLLNEARDRAKILLENYVNNMGKLSGQTYNITWVEVDNEGRPIK